jgi:hypothetical protein
MSMTSRVVFDSQTKRALIGARFCFARGKKIARRSSCGKSHSDIAEVDA